MKEIAMPKSKALTEKECYEELVRIVKIYCYQAVVREEIDFFRWWLKNVLTRLSEYAATIPAWETNLYAVPKKQN